jgi:hypothetical protein
MISRNVKEYRRYFSGKKTSEASCPKQKPWPTGFERNERHDSRLDFLHSRPIRERQSQQGWKRRFQKGFTILANYQFAKAIDDSSANKQNGNSRTNPFNQRFDKGLADFHRAHVLNFSGLYELPFIPANPWMRALAGGWNLNAILSANSGSPLTIGSGVDNARTGTGGQRADLVGDPYITGNRTHQEQITEWLRRAAFAPNAIGTYGSLGRGTYFGPGLASLDLGLVKGFVVKERLNAQLRFEAFNSLNRVNFGNPTTALNSGNFMKITSAGDPRILQLALRVSF